jgi:hypothetical protein
VTRIICLNYIIPKLRKGEDSKEEQKACENKGGRNEGKNKFEGRE